ncbi:MAG: hypothetical protein GOMPHAMPRED_002822 [Gomphillus americanus]|uniref:Pyrroline-5-carboxylate reductase n=1 Tax=Gomphillus americanus TaxID=1940652 RepID=A0A8H3IQ77_9LECA|nr:MAG: hypothetical protein GOMPHAMPRED_002822 [Gomphillus americanus]
MVVTHPITRSLVQRREHVIAILGCGKLGTAILRGLLDAEQNISVGDHRKLKIIACVRRAESATKLQSTLASYKDSVVVLTNDNMTAASQADVIVLGCKSGVLHEVLGEAGMRESLSGKLVISILAGATEGQIRMALSNGQSASSVNKEIEPQIICAIPNVASAVRQSMTVVSKVDRASLTPENFALASDILARLGWVVELDENHLNMGFILSAAGPAYIAVMLEALASAAVSSGVPREYALQMAARTMQGTAELILGGDSPAKVTENVCTPLGCSEKGLKVIQQGNLSGILVNALQEAERAIVKR